MGDFVIFSYFFRISGLEGFSILYHAREISTQVPGGRGIFPNGFVAKRKQGLEGQGTCSKCLARIIFSAVGSFGH